MPNFDLAPPIRTVDGLLAVPIDISRVTAILQFDAATNTATADVNVEFEVGPHAGNPIFDLRQNIAAAWLDGVPVLPAQMAHHDFGGGPDAQLRIIERVVPAGTMHLLRLQYTLGTPLAPLPPGRYLPQMTWSAGPRLLFNFGFTDLRPGRYLETWLPSNLIFDQFALDIDLQLTNTTIGHSLITNGSVTPIGINHWTVAFPDRFTALSPMLELRATDTLDSLIGTVVLPITGLTVNVELWKLSSNPAALSPLMTSIANYLTTNENNYGGYLHGNRFVAFIIAGGMEYDGGTTTEIGALRHETFHSWFGRGIKPASQNDGWWDEAWNEYNMAGASSAIPFNFANPPVTLFTQNPFVRVTADGSYSLGMTFFEGLAALMGVGNLVNIMSEFYRTYNTRPATTLQLEALLLCRSGNQAVVDAFHRFVYGFPNSGPDLWLKDDPAHTGSDSWGGSFWDSPDLWVRHIDDGIALHQAPAYGQDNWLYARVRNRSTTATANHFVVAFNVRPFAGTEFLYPNDFLPCMAAATGFNLAPGASVVVKAKWPRALVPPAGTHACLLASLHARLEHPLPGTHVWEHNNLAQKNLTIMDMDAGDWAVVPFVIEALEMHRSRGYLLEIVQAADGLAAPFSLLHPEEVALNGNRLAKAKKLLFPPTDKDVELLECGGGHLHEGEEQQRNLGFWTSKAANHITARFNGYFAQPFDAKAKTRIPLDTKNKNEQVLMGIKIEVPSTAKPGDLIKFDIVKKANPGCFLKKRKTLGGIAIHIRVH